MVRRTYPRISLAKDEAFCLTCKKPVKLMNPTKKQKGRLHYWVSECPILWSQVSKNYHKGQIARMINRGNWKLVREYLLYREEVDLLSEKSLRLEETWLNHLSRWAQEKSFEKAPKIRPTLPEYMLNARLDGSGELLSHAYIKS